MTKFDEGLMAARRGDMVCSCPYGKGSQEYADWHKGFRHGKKRDEATDLTHG